jgi:hypothetical protein
VGKVQGREGSHRFCWGALLLLPGRVFVVTLLVVHTDK